MKEDFLHFIWVNNLYKNTHLKTISGKEVLVLKSGWLNTNSGPDFYNAMIEIDQIKWVGNVEIHVNSSHWYLHKHEQDSAYDTIILHVVWKDDMPIFDKENNQIETLELCNYVSKNILSNYHSLLKIESNFIACEQQVHKIDNFILNQWFEKLYLEKLEQKSIIINELLLKHNNDWEAVLFILLAKNFGLNVNGSAFEEIAKSIPFNVVKKESCNVFSLESLLFGQAGLLEDELLDNYYKKLKTEYTFLAQKFNLKREVHTKAKYFRLRPSNFPTIRLSQLANLYVNERSLFSRLMNTNDLELFYGILKIGVSTYWKTHYSFTSSTDSKDRKLTKSFMDLLLINTIIPLQFVYQKYLGKSTIEQQMAILIQLKSEKNSVIKKFNSIGINSATALDSQAILQLYKNYCTHKKCMQCLIGSKIISS